MQASLRRAMFFAPSLTDGPIGECLSLCCWSSIDNCLYHERSSEWAGHDDLPPQAILSQKQTITRQHKRISYGSKKFQHESDAGGNNGREIQHRWRLAPRKKPGRTRWEARRCSYSSLEAGLTLHHAKCKFSANPVTSLPPVPSRMIL